MWKLSAPSLEDWEENLWRWGTLRFASGHCPEYPWPWFTGQEEESSLTRRRSCSTSPLAITITWRCWRISAACCANEFFQHGRSIEWAKKRFTTEHTETTE